MKPFLSAATRHHFPIMVSLDTVIWTCPGIRRINVDENTIVSLQWQEDLTRIHKVFTNDFAFQSVYKDPQSGEQIVKYHGRHGLPRNAPSQTRRLEKVAISKEVALRSKGRIRASDVAVRNIDQYFLDFNLGQRRQYTVQKNPQGYLVITLNDILQADPSKSPATLIRQILDKMFSDGFFVITDRNGKPATAVSLDDCIAKCLEIGKLSQIDLAIDLSTAILDLEMPGILESYSAAGGFWQCESSTLYLRKDKTSPKGQVYDRGLKDMVDRGESPESIGRMAGKHSTIRFERQTIRSKINVIEKKYPGFSALSQDRMIQILLDEMCNLLYQLFKPIPPKKRLALYNRVGLLTSPDFPIASRFSERWYRRKLFSLLAEHFSIERQQCRQQTGKSSQVA
jgi:hypothetical protein